MCMKFIQHTQQFFFKITKNLPIQNVKEPYFPESKVKVPQFQNLLNVKKIKFIFRI